MTMDRIRDKYGEDAILSAGMMLEEPDTSTRNPKAKGPSPVEPY